MHIELLELAYYYSISTKTGTKVGTNMVVDICLQQGIHHSHQASEYPLSPSYLLQDEPAKRLEEE